ncbi:MAG: hypothetical protein Fur0012_07790 [Elusimicrobiota bacterium]
MNKVEQLLGRDSAKEFKYRPGDTVKVHTKVVEGDTERIQVFDGLVIAVKGSGVARTFTVRKISYGVGVERVFPVNSPRIDKIELVKSGKVRRAKLNYIRELSGKASRLQEKDEIAQQEQPEVKPQPAAADTNTAANPTASAQ